MKAGVRRQLLEAGIDASVIPEDWLSYIVAATRKWMSTTRDGAQDAAELIGIQTIRGSNDKAYALVAPDETVEHVIKGDDVYFLQGLIVEGRVTPPQQLRIFEKGREQCRGCGTLVPCTQVIRDPYNDHLDTLCNYCRTFHDHPQVRDTGGFDVCGQCTVTSCANHPGRTHANHFCLEKPDSTERSY